MRTITADLVAGQPMEFGVPGRRLEILLASNPVTVSLQDVNGTEITNGRSADIDAGTYFAPEGPDGRLRGFSRFTLTSSTTQTVKIGVSNGDSGTRRVAGTVSIANVNGAFTNSQKTVTNASFGLVAANSSRRYLLIQNNDASGDIYVRLDGNTVSAANGVKIPAGGSYELQGYVPTGAITAIGTIASNANIVVVEG